MHIPFDFPPLTQDQTDIIIGSLLGDASLHFNQYSNGNSKFLKTQSCKDIKGIDKKDYLEWHLQALKPYSNNEIKNKTFYHKIVNLNYNPINVKCDKPTYDGGYVFTTHCHPIFTEMMKVWYLCDEMGNFVKRDNRIVKVVPRDIRLTPLLLCVWYMDDGSACQSDANLVLCTNGFTFDECQFLVDRLRIDLGIKSHVKPRRHQFMIYVGRKSYFDFIDMIRPLVQWNCFRYKLDDSTYDKLTQIGEHHSQAKLTNDNIMSIVDLAKQGVRHNEIGSQLKVSQATVSMILEGRRWQHLTGIRYEPKKPRISQETKVKILELCKTMNQGQIAEELGISSASVSRTINAC